MQRFYLLTAICGVIALTCGSVLGFTILTMAPDDSGGPNGGPPDLPAVLQRVQQESQMLQDKREVIKDKADLVDYRLGNFVTHLKAHENKLELSLRQLHTSLQISQASVRSAAARFRLALNNLSAYNKSFDVQTRYAAQQSGRFAVMGGGKGELQPSWNGMGQFQEVLQARDQFRLQLMNFENVVEQERLNANVSLASLQQEIAGTLNGLAALQVEGLANQTDMLGLYEQLINFANRFGMLAGQAVSLPANVRPGEFTGEAWRSLLNQISNQVRSGMTSEAILEQVRQNLRNDRDIQTALHFADSEISPRFRHR